MKTKAELWENIEKSIEVFDNEEGSDFSIESQNVSKITHLLSNFELQMLLMKISNPDYISKFDYTALVDLQDKITQLKENLDTAKEEIDLDEFYKRGEILNFKKLKKIFKDRNLKKMFPNFNFERYEQLFKNPVLVLENWHGEKIPYDKFLVKKLMLGINQMIFSEMDLYMINVGKEGAGKSCFSSQLLLYLYYVLKEVGLVEYAYDVKKLFFSSLSSMAEEQDLQKDNDFFRLMTLDEAYELNRQNFRDEFSKNFKDDMRSSRKMLRIIQLNLPQLGELEVAITLTRCNFIFYCDMDSEPETGTVKKGEIYMYILPRGKKIYSPYQRRNIGDEEIVNSISKVMKDKQDSYKGLPKNCLIHKFNAEGVWGFDKSKYDAHIKKENKKRRMSGNIRLTDYIGYILYKKLPAIKQWGTFDMSDSNDKKMYFTIQKFIKTQIKHRYILNPEILRKFDQIYGE
jgi:hypothetical protein